MSKSKPVKGRNVNIEQLYKKKVQADLERGASLEEVVKKYPVSLYYVKKWGREVFKQMDMDMLVRTRFKWCVQTACSSAQDQMIDATPDYEVCDISEATWEKWSVIIRNTMYDLCKEVVQRK